MNPFTLPTLALTAAAMGLSASPLHAQQSPSRAFRPRVRMVTTGGPESEVIDFEGLLPGTIVSSVFTANGLGPVEVTAINGDLRANAAVVFDSSEPTGEDPDLGTPNGDFGGPGVGRGGQNGSPFQNDQSQEHVLILAEDLVDANEDGLVDDPDDADARLAPFVFDFASLTPVTMHSLTLIDVDGERVPPRAELFDPSGSSLGFVSLPMVGDNGLAVVDFGSVENVATLVVEFNGSGALDDLRFTPECRGTLGDFVWNDIDLDGVQDPSEPGIEGVTVRLLDEKGGTVATSVTNRSGAYGFAEVCAGDYTIVVDERTLPRDFLPTDCFATRDDELDSNCSPYPVSIPNNFTEDLSIDFGFACPCIGQIGDFVWNDLDEDGIQDEGEPGLEGVVIRLYDALDDDDGGEGDDEPGEGGSGDPEPIATVTTGPGGFYTFMGLCAGTYVVEVDESTVPEDFIPPTCNTGVDDTIDNDCSPALVTLPTDTTIDTTTDFAYRARFLGVIGDFIWFDRNCDGFQDLAPPFPFFGEPMAGEFGVDGVEVLLCDDMGVVLQRQTSNLDGAYSFTGLQQGIYEVVVNESTVPMNLEPSPCNVPGGDDSADNDCSPFPVTLETEPGVVGGGPIEVRITIDFGYREAECDSTFACTTNFWRENEDLWPEPYGPLTFFDDVFENAFPGYTLQRVINRPGTGIFALGRQVVTALFNASSPDVDYPLTVDEVISLFDNSFDATGPEIIALGDYFAFLNAQMCPLLNR